MAVQVTVQLLQHRIRTTLEHLVPFLGLANAPMVSYFTQQLWKTYVPPEIQQEIQTTSDIAHAVDIYWQHLNEPASSAERLQHFRSFLFAAKQCHLDSMPDMWTTPDKLKTIFDGHDIKALSIHGFMSTKKNHEVHIAADVIANICAAKQYREALGVIDAGDGKGYLSTRLSLEHNIKVLGIDYNPVNTLGALLRSEKFERYWDVMRTKAEIIADGNTPEKQTRRKRKEKRAKKLQDEPVPPVTNDNYKNATHFITPQTDFIKLFGDNFNMHADEVPGLCLSGLHTCGNLASSCLRIFSENKQIEAVCNIGCCYHLLNEQFSQFVYRSIRRERSPDSVKRQVCEPTEDVAEQSFGFPMSEYLVERKTKLGRNARMVACQSVHRVVDRKELPSDHLFFRALLEVLIQRKCPQYEDRIEVGRMKQCHTFAEYARKAAKRNPALQFDDLTDHELEALYDEFKDERPRLDVYYLMRVSIAAVVEGLIMLDRFLYLKELERGKGMSHLVRFFDPVVSPRCYGLIAMKHFK